MRAFLLFLSLAGFAFGDDISMTPREMAQEKVDRMFEFPTLSHRDQWYVPFSFETLYGSSDAFLTLKFPEHIEVYRITPLYIPQPPPGAKTILGHQILAGPRVPSEWSRKEFFKLFTSKSTFRDRSRCVQLPVILVRAISR